MFYFGSSEYLSDFDYYGGDGNGSYLMGGFVFL